jgi:hypothetical protein
MKVLQIVGSGQEILDEAGKTLTRLGLPPRDNARK